MGVIVPAKATAEADADWQRRGNLPRLERPSGIAVAGGRLSEGVTSFQTYFFISSSRDFFNFDV